MIISEKKVKVPGRIYNLQIQCASVRRMTALEWLLLKTIQKSAEDSSLANSTLKSVFDDVFEFQNSALLINPCLDELESRDFITYYDEKMDYNIMEFKDIILTELGQFLLREGMILKDDKTMSLKVYYNPLTQEISSLDPLEININDVDIVEFGSDTDYSNDSLEEHIKHLLQMGKIEDGRFAASKLYIKNMDIGEQMYWSTGNLIKFKLSSDLKTLNTIPQILDPSMKRRLGELLVPHEFSSKILSKLVSSANIKIKNIIGSGDRIKQSILNICKQESKMFAINKLFYDLYKNNISAFDGKIVFIYSKKDKFNIEKVSSRKKSWILITIPEEFPIKSCSVIDRRQNHICVCNAECRYEGEILNIPIAVEDSRAADYPLEQWVMKYITASLKDGNIRVTALLSLFENVPNDVYSILFDRWNKMRFDDIVKDFKSIEEDFNILYGPVMLSDQIIGLLSDKIIECCRAKHMNIADDFFNIQFIRRTELYNVLIHTIIMNMESPHNYGQLTSLFNTFHITSENTLNEEWFSILYTDEIVKELICNVFNEKLSYLSYRNNRWEMFFKEYRECIKIIEALLQNIVLNKKNDFSVVQSALNICTNPALLQIKVNELMDKNRYLESKGFEYDFILKQKYGDSAEVYENNLKILGTLLKDNLVFQPSLQGKKIYIIDTCALIHHPEILLYFNEDEYVRIPTVVLDELSKIKDNRSQKYGSSESSIARKVARELEKEYIPLFNVQKSFRLMIENADLKLLPSDLDTQIPDNQILAVALKYTESEVYIISDDRIFRLISLSQKIKVIKSDDFIVSHKKYAKSLPDWKKTLPAIESEDNIKSDIPSEYDDLPIRVLKKYSAEITDVMCNYLIQHKIKTIGDFKKLTEKQLSSLPANSKQQVQKNSLLKILKHKELLLAKLSL